MNCDKCGQPTRRLDGNGLGMMKCGECLSNETGTVVLCFLVGFALLITCLLAFG